MEKFLRRISLLTALLFVVFVNSNIALASNFLSGNIKSYDVKEYDQIKKIKAMDEESLLKSGLSKDEVKKIKSFDIKKELYSMKNLSEEELRKLGYTEKDILTLKNFKGTDAEIYALTGTIRCTAYKYHHYYDSSSDKTYAKFILTFYWDKKPLVIHYDIMAASWNNDFLIDKTNTKTSITYTNPNNNNSVVKIGPKEFNLNSVKSVFSMLYVQNTAAYYASSGRLELCLYKKGKASNIATVLKYGHSILPVTPSISIGSGGISFSLTPSNAIKEEFSEYLASTL
ncbi:hypothetical protein ACQRBF_08120 [Peptoniphilaceae bacterium SGI.131]